MSIENFKINIQEFELKKFQKVLNLCNSPIEELFVGKVYSFFLTKGLSINLITQSVEEFEHTEDGPAVTFIMNFIHNIQFSIPNKFALLIL